MLTVTSAPVRSLRTSVPASGERRCCLGWGECHRWAPDVYPLDEDGKIGVHLLEVPAEHAEAAWWGAAACPQQAITVIGPPSEYWVNRFQQAADSADRAAT